MSVPDIRSGQWALAPFLTRELDAEHFLIMRRSDGASAVLDRTWQPVFEELGVFRTLAEHAEVIAHRIPALQASQQTVQEVLAQIIAKGLFQSAELLAAQTRQGAAVAAVPTDAPAIVITTCERPEALQRLLDSLIANEERSGNRWRFEVIDDSRSAPIQAQNSALVRDVKRRLDVDYLGAAEQREFLDGLFRAVPEAQGARWLVERDAGELEPTYGLPVNFALLRHAGGRLLLLDDDAVIRAARVPGGARGARFDNHLQAEAFVTLEEARQALEPYRQDPFEAHATALGHPVGAVLEDAVCEGIESAFCGNNIAHLANLDPLRSRVHYTLNGVLGDSGSYSDLFLFHQKNTQALRKIAGSDTRYGQLKQSDRIVYRGSPWPSLYSNGWLHQVTCVGLDASRYLPPVYPAGRGEDTLLGVLMHFLYPSDFGLMLPFTLEHQPVCKRAWRFDAGVFSFEAKVLGLLTWHLSGLRTLQEYAPDAKMAVFAETLRQRFNRERPASSLRGRVRINYLRFLAGNFRLLSDAAASVEEAAPLWRRDVEELNDALIEKLSDPPSISPEEEERLRRVLLRYAEAIDGWNRLFKFRLS